VTWASEKTLRNCRKNDHRYLRNNKTAASDGPGTGGERDVSRWLNRDFRAEEDGDRVSGHVDKKRERIVDVSMGTYQSVQEKSVLQR